ncbi:MAG TPA: GNAT family N-acetyltransferase [Azospirillaceae bacterium]|nr:GNAT family N-acetyltransferase [Azospirillaceae bacterium]
MLVRERTPEDAEWIERLLVQRWGSTVMVVHGDTYDAATLPALVAGAQDGLATYRIIGDEAELVTLDAVRPGLGVGSALVEALVDRLRGTGVRRLRVTTTNDNLDALRFYQRRSFRLLRLRAGAVDEARRIKPAIPETGAHGIPLHDEIDLWRSIPGTPAEGSG